MMIKKFKFILGACLLSNLVHGEMFKRLSSSQQPLSSFDSVLLSNSTGKKVMHELLLSGRKPSIEDLLGQVELSYYRHNGFRTKDLGLHQSIDSYTYQYNLKNQRMLVESKFLTSWPKQYHPFVSLGLGQTQNNLATLSDLILAESNTTNPNNSLSYLLGLGFEKELSSNTRLGAMYRWVNLSPMSPGSTSLMLSNNHLQVSEFSLQLSYMR